MKCNCLHKINHPCNCRGCWCNKHWNMKKKFKSSKFNLPVDKTKRPPDYATSLDQLKEFKPNNHATTRIKR